MADRVTARNLLPYTDSEKYIIIFLQIIISATINNVTKNE
jgi:hypothetical protein